MIVIVIVIEIIEFVNTKTWTYRAVRGSWPSWMRDPIVLETAERADGSETARRGLARGVVRGVFLRREEGVAARRTGVEERLRRCSSGVRDRRRAMVWGMMRDSGRSRRGFGVEEISRLD